MTSHPRTRLTGVRLIVARSLWLLLAALYIGAFCLVVVPTTITQPPVRDTLSVEWTPEETRFALAQLGWSVEGYARFDSWTNLVLSLVYFALGLFIFWRRSDDWMALLISLVFLSTLSTTATDTLARLDPAWEVVGTVNGSLTSMLLIVIFYLFPSGHFVPRWTRWAALLLGAIQLFRIFRPDLYDRIGLLLVPPLFGSGVAAQLYRYVRVADPVQRRQTKWVVFGLTVGALPLVVYVSVLFSVPELRAPTAQGIIGFLGGVLLWTAFLIVLPVSFTIAILRSGLWDIDFLINRTLVYGTLTATLALIYLGSILMLQALLRPIVGGDSELATVASTLAIAALFQPLRRRIQNGIDRRFYRRKYDAARTLQAFSSRLRDDIDVQLLTDGMIAVVQETLQPEFVGLWLKSADAAPMLPPQGGRAKGAG